MSSDTFSRVGPSETRQTRSGQGRLSPGRNRTRRRQQMGEPTVPFVPDKAKTSRRRQRIDEPQPAEPAPAEERSGLMPRAQKNPNRVIENSGGRGKRQRVPHIARRLRPGGLYRWMRRFRIPLAMVMGLCAVAAVMLAVEGAQVQTTTAVRVTQPVAVGEVLSESAVEQFEVDTAAVPEDHSAEVSDFQGATVATALPKGTVLHPSQFLGPGLLEGQDADVSAVPVRPADTAIISLLSPGMKVDVYSSSDAPEEQEVTARVAQSAPVIWIPQSGGEDWITGSEGGSDVVVLAVDADTAEQIAQATHRGRLHLNVVG